MQLASLAAEAESSELLHETGGGPGDTSVASSQLTAFLVQHGVLSPLRPPAAASLTVSAASAPFARASSSGRGREQQQQQLPQPQGQLQNVSYEIVMTPERRRRHYDAQEEVEEAAAQGQQQGHQPLAAGAVPPVQGITGEEGAEGTHSPRSGISSLGLASPPHRPAPSGAAMQWGTGGEPLMVQQAQQQQGRPAAASGPGREEREGWAAVSQLLRSEGYRTGSGGEAPEEILQALRQVRA